ncbi:hypothetical protein ABC977_00045 [Thioalkalicoccus limnaeus]|uniref:Uncharacterized protein n=1 Tax=Thioalkalicoccus limnaeus TaxID=120681 RepID=A0ABV4BAK8_9GAMM
MPRKALALQARQRQRHGRDLLGEPVLDDDLDAGIDRGVGSRDRCGAVTCLDKGDARRLIARRSG